ncbi:aldehyde dehydrogenase family protein [Roseivirga sp. E12]|uniref:aldehyde dehydrogenase family protein n=1 Tax=Roseivirga sp. E12 TaxID=2819237 RepID=UPI001ABD0CAA|nr:aldehyde dehydrogenase family protein [Roseivirga sp. E12]MBO3699932.1 aldehyde dehydrogenase family protein [Roseivirga sp. E12]
MTETSSDIIRNRLTAQNAFFKKGTTRSVDGRRSSLKKLRATILANQEKITSALHTDLGKSPEEAFITEIGLVIKEIDLHIKNVGRWSKTKRVHTPIYLLPSSSHLKYEPRGTVLIVAPWNYPFQLIMTPLIGAISAGNCAMLKPSEFSPHINAVMDEIIQDVFEPDHVSMVHGGKPTNQALFAEKFDMIFFTGSTMLGKVVAKAAAERLTPTVLELGGKSPCIIDESADLETTARKIAWGKTVNLGQTCIAPDYLLVHTNIKEELQAKIIGYWKTFYGDDPQKSEFLPRMVTEQAFDRVTNYLSQGRVVHGGQINREDKYIAPTLMDDVDLGGSIMDEEIFGPILPLITYENIEEAIKFVNGKEKPLAYYYFGKSTKAKRLLEENTSGGVCINDTLIHISNHALPFGGVGSSGMGRYHGKHSFEAFSNARAIMKSPTWIDVPFRYPPFKYFSIVKKILS